MYIEHTHFRAITQDKNLGFDGNILALFMNAQSDFLWLMGDDDDLDTAQLDNLITLLINHPDTGLVYLAYRQDCEPIEQSISTSKFGIQEMDAQEYCDKILAQSTLISTNIINMALFRTITLNHDCLSKEWLQVHILLSIAEQLKKQNGMAVVVHDCIVIQRTGNSSYLDNDWVKIFVDYFKYTIDHTPHEDLKCDSFIAIFYQLNIRRRFLRLGRQLSIMEAVHCYRRITSIFKPSFNDRAQFWFFTLAFKIFGKDRLKNLLNPRWLLGSFLRIFFSFKSINNPAALNKILIMDFGHVGDILLSLPAVSALKSILPSAKIDFACGEWASELLEKQDQINKVIIFNHPFQNRKKQTLLAAIWEIVRFIYEIRRSRYDLTLDLQGSLSSALINLMTKSAYKGGRDRAGYNFPYSVISSAFSGPEAVNKIDLIKKIDPKAAFMGYQLSILPIDKEKVDLLLDSHQLKKYIVIQPQTPWQPRNWGGHNYYSLLEKLIGETHLSVVLVGNQAEKQANERLVALAPSKINNFSGMLSLLETACLISQARLFIGCDSGPAHLAAAVGTPIICLMGPGEYPRFAPYNPQAKIRIVRHVVCSLQLGNHCRQVYGKDACKRGENICMQSLPVDEVYAAIKEVISL